MIKKIKNKLSNENGFTLIELLVVISIIAILFVTLLPQIDFAGDRARQAGVKTDFHTFQIAAEAYLRETAGEGSGAAGLRGSELNKYLDINMQLAISATPPAGYFAGDQVSAKLDPWGQQYAVRIYGGNGSAANQRKIEVFSFGKSEARTTSAMSDFKMATYYKQGQTGTCTLGFDNNNLVAHTNLVATVTDCANGTGTAVTN